MLSLDTKMMITYIYY